MNCLLPGDASVVKLSCQQEPSSGALLKWDLWLSLGEQ
jgi:hypothetical protein